jgi:hypothetical protein
MIELKSPTCLLDKLLKEVITFALKNVGLKNISEAFAIKKGAVGVH